MAVKLLYRANNAVKTLTCLESGIEIPKPYIRVNTSGYLPLTTQTSTGIKVQINGVEYSPAKSTFITMSTTITQNFTSHKGDLGETVSGSWNQGMQDRSVRAYNGNVTSYSYRKTYSAWEQDFTRSSWFTKLGSGGYVGTESQELPDKETLYSSDGWVPVGEYYNSTITIINNSIRKNLWGVHGVAESKVVPIMFRYTSKSTPFIILSNSVSSNYPGTSSSATFLSYNSASNTGAVIATMGGNESVHYKDEVSIGISSGSAWKNRSVRTAAENTNYSVSFTYMSNQLEGITDYGRIIQSDTISHCTSIATTTSTFGGIATKETVFSILQTGNVRCDGARRSTAIISRLNNGAQRVYSTYSMNYPAQIGFNATNTYILSSETYGINSYVTNFDLAYVFTTENGKGININKIQSQSVLNGTNTYYYSSSTYEYYNNATFTECISTSYTGNRFPCDTVVLYYSDRVINTNSTYFVDTASPTTIYFTYTAITTQQRNIYT